MFGGLGEVEMAGVLILVSFSGGVGKKRLEGFSF